MGKTKKLKLVDDQTAQVRAKKLKKRRTRWEWNFQLLIGSLIVAAIIFAGGFFSYQHFSKSTADDFRSQAARAEDEGRVDDQLSWLKRLARLDPKSTDILVKIAKIADDKVDQTPPAKRWAALNAATNAISIALGHIGSNLPEKEELRQRLIKRYVEMGGTWNREVESQMIMLNPPAEDPMATRQLALALAGQVRDGYYSRRTPKDSGSHWEVLANEPPGDVVLQALDLNPVDLDLLASLLDLSSNNDRLFSLEPENGKSDSELLSEILAQRIGLLKGDDRSRAMLIRYRFDSRRDPAGALEQLAVGSTSAFNRLAALKVELTKDEGSAEETSNNNFWDFVLVSNISRLTEDAQLANRYFELLLEVGPEIVEPERLEVVYFLRARHLSRQGTPDLAITLIEEGLNKLGEDRLGLLASLTKLKIDSSWNSKKIGEPGEIEKLNKTLARFKKATDAASLDLAKTARLYDARTRFNRGKAIDVAKWRIDVMQAILDAGKGNRQTAIQTLKSSLSNVTIDDAERLDVCRRLYELHQLSGNADLAAEALDQALLIRPNDLVLRRRAALAWSESGNSDKAQRHWQELGDTDVFAKLQVIHAKAKYQLGLPKDLQDLSGVRIEAEKFLNQLQQATEPDSATSRLIRQLEFFLVTLPSDNVGLAEFRARDETVASVMRLADKYKDDSDIQSMAAVLLAVSGKLPLAEETLARISDNEVDDRLLKSVTRAKILAVDRKFSQAAESLIQASVSEKNLTVSAKMLRAAANFAQLGDNPVIAYQALTKIPETQMSYQDLFLAASIGRDLPTGAIVEGKQESAEEIFNYWKSKLREKEGDDGTVWQLLEAKSGIRQLFKTGTTDRDDPTFQNIKTIANRLLVRRPAWGEVISLAGWVAAFEGRSAEAVERLRSGISAGDRSSATRSLLWGQLYLAGRNSEANQEIAKYQVINASSINAYDGTAKDAVGIASSAVKDWPKNLLSHLVLARTAMVVASGTKKRTKREALLVEAKNALDNVESLTGGGDRFPVFSAELALSTQSGDRKAIEDLLRQIENSELSVYDKSILLAVGNLELRNPKVALKHALIADNLRSSKTTKLVLSAVYQSQKNWEELVSVLRAALLIAPDDQLVKRYLQRALVLQGGDIDWRELSRLQDGQGRLSYAILLISSGQEEKQIEGEKLLRKIAEENGVQGLAATRVLGVLLRVKAAEALRANDATQLESLVQQTIEVYDPLLQRDSGNYQDLITFADFLLKYSGSKHQEKIAQLLKEISEIDDASLAWLSLSLRFANLTDNNASSPEIADQWLVRAQEDDVMTTSQILVAGSRLLLSNQVEGKALEWIEQAYKDMPKKLVGLFVAILIKSKKSDRAIQVCLEHYQSNDQDVNAALLLANTLFNSNTQIPMSCKSVLEDSLRRYPNNILLLESVGTLQMQQGNFRAATELLERARLVCREQNQEVNLVTNNNLAMLYTQIPGSEAKALEPIQAALSQRKAPELFDTLGAVRLAMGEPEKAEKIFRELVKQSDEPRYRFHLVLALLAQNKKTIADEEWKQINIEKLDRTGLTGGERNRLEELLIEQNAENTTSSQKELAQ